MGSGYLPGKDKMKPSDPVEKYLPAEAEKKTQTTQGDVKIISATPPPVDLNRENRILALEAATRQVSGVAIFTSSANVLSAAREYEAYLRGDK